MGTGFVATQAPRQFLTGRVSRDSRVTAWEQHNERALVALECRPMRTQFEGQEITRKVGEVHVAEVRATPHVVERSAEVIAKSPEASVLIYLTLAGESTFYDEAGALVTRPGEAVVCHSDRPFMRSFSRGLRELVFKIPAHTWDDAGLAETVTEPVVITAGTPGLGVLRRGLEALLRGAPVVAVGHGVEPVDEARWLVSLASGLVKDDLDSGSSASHVRNAQHFIALHLRDPRLSAGKIATAIGISERQLSRVFAEAGLTVPSWVAQQRVRFAARMLRSDHFDWSLADLAAYVGFGTYGSFTRTFRAHLGFLPSQVRRHTWSMS